MCYLWPLPEAAAPPPTPPECADVALLDVPMREVELLLLVPLECPADEVSVEDTKEFVELDGRVTKEIARELEVAEEFTPFRTLTGATITPIPASVFAEPCRSTLAEVRPRCPKTSRGTPRPAEC